MQSKQLVLDDTQENSSSNGFTGNFKNYANLSALGALIVICISLSLFVMNQSKSEIAAFREETKEQRVWFSEEMRQLRTTEEARTDKIVKAIECLTRVVQEKKE